MKRIILNQKVTYKNKFHEIYSEYLFFLPYTLILFVLCFLYNLDIDIVENIKRSFEFCIIFISIIGIFYNYALLLFLLLFVGYFNKEIITIVVIMFIFIVLPLIFSFLFEIFNVQLVIIDFNSQNFISIILYFAISLVTLTFIMLVLKIYYLIKK